MIDYPYPLNMFLDIVLTFDFGLSYIRFHIQNKSFILLKRKRDNSINKKNKKTRMGFYQTSDVEWPKSRRRRWSLRHDDWFLDKLSFDRS